MHTLEYPTVTMVTATTVDEGAAGTTTPLMAFIQLDRLAPADLTVDWQAINNTATDEQGLRGRRRTGR